MLGATIVILIALVIGEDSPSRAVQIVSAIIGVASAAVLIGLIARD